MIFTNFASALAMASIFGSAVLANPVRIATSASSVSTSETDSVNDAVKASENPPPNRCCMFNCMLCSPEECQGPDPVCMMNPWFTNCCNYETRKLVANSKGNPSKEINMPVLAAETRSDVASSVSINNASVKSRSETKASHCCLPGCWACPAELCHHEEPFYRMSPLFNTCCAEEVKRPDANPKLDTDQEVNQVVHSAETQLEKRVIFKCCTSGCGHCLLTECSGPQDPRCLQVWFCNTCCPQKEEPKDVPGETTHKTIFVREAEFDAEIEAVFIDELIKDPQDLPDESTPKTPAPTPRSLPAYVPIESLHLEVVNDAKETKDVASVDEPQVVKRAEGRCCLPGCWDCQVTSCGGPKDETCNGPTLYNTCCAEALDQPKGPRSLHSTWAPVEPVVHEVVKDAEQTKEIARGEDPSVNKRTPPNQCCAVGCTVCSSVQCGVDKPCVGWFYSMCCNYEVQPEDPKDHPN
ncbi:hypothetical protein QBC35DRAFT_543950 [Podospora australis]|uniref:Uncharacterized protein n=1 Tax=Podospora australis TaxID=1536484 RepID=A0AAN6WJS2_9PEZI|nr:hypothetical protein QBC35DRAFT_543950 [Podospora australis]